MKRMAKTLAMFLFIVACFSMKQANAQSILNPSDPLITYNPASPPAEPAWGTIGKWVRTVRLTYNTDSWKAYIYKTIPFRLKFPKTYNPTANDGKKYPMIVFFHGAGESGPKTDNEFSLANGGPVFTAAVDNGKFDGYILVMQMPGSGWSQSYIDFACEIADYMVINNKLDPFRIINNGLSAGAGACWDMTIRHPNYMAASLPMSGIGVGHKDSVNVYKYTPIWYFQGGLDKSPDPNTALEVKAVIDQVGANFKYTMYPNLGHGTWTTAWNEPDFYPFCSRAYAANPWTLLGRTEFCPGDPINVRIGVAPYYSAYEWRKDGQLISGATGNSIVATSTGVYDVRIRKGTIWSDWSHTPVTIKLKDPTVTPPITVSGLMSKVIPALDTANVTLSVPEGYVSYEWQKVGNGTTIGTSRELSVTSPGDYIVRVTEQFGCSSSFSAPFTVISANGANKPSAAANLIASALSKTSVRLDWSDNPSPQFNETNYEIYQGVQAGGPYKLVGITDADVITYTINGLTPNTTYYYKVRAVNNTAAASNSNEASAKTDVDTQPPTAPVNLAVVSTSRTSVDLHWNASTDEVGVVRYEVYINGVKSYSTTDTDFSANGLITKKTYNFFVRAVDGAGNQSANSNQVTAQPLLNGLNYKYYTFTGNWSNLPDFTTLTPAATGNMPNVAITPRTQDDNFAFLWEGYISIPTTGTYTFATQSDDGSKLYLGPLNGTASPYTYSGTALVNNDGLHGSQAKTSAPVTLVAGVYPIAMTFFEQGGGEVMTVGWKTPSSGTSYVAIPNSAFTESAANNGSAPDAPSNLVATATAFNNINLTWTDNSNNETGFEIWRSTSPSSGFAIVGAAAANATAYSDNTVAASTTYYYQIKAIGLFGESALVDNLKDPEANWLFNNSYTDASGNGKTLTASSSPTFDAADKQEGTHALKLNGTNQYVTMPTSGSFLQTAYSQKSVAFWMKSGNNTGNRVIVDIGGSDDGMALMLNSNTLIAGIVSNNQSSNRKNFAVAYTSTGWNHIALVYSGNSLKLYVNGVLAGSNNSLPFSSLTSTTNGSRIGTVNGSNAFATGTGFFNGRIDNFAIFPTALTQADVVNLMNDFPAGLSFATTPGLPAVPANPSNLVASGTSTSSNSINWTDNAANETGYEVFRSNNTNANYIKIASLPANSNSLADTGLFSNAVYYYKVRATGVGGNSSYSNEDSALTQNNLPVVTPVANQNMHYHSTVDVNVAATDADGEYVTLTINNLPAFATFQQTASGAGKITFNPNGTQGTFNNVTVVATDAHGGTGSSAFNLVVNDNYSPVISAISNYSITENQSLTIPLSATDQNAGDVLTWSVSNLPDNFTLTQGVVNGSASLQLTPTFAGSGTYTVQVNVSDGKGGTASRQFTLTVADKDPSTYIYTRIKYANTMGAPWNNITGVTTNNLKDENNNTTSVGLNFLQSWWLPYNAGPVTGNNSGVYPDGVLNDFWYFGYYGGPETANLAVTGLDPAKKYNLTFYAGSVFNGFPDNGTTNYKVGTKTVSLYVQNNTQNTVSINNISPAADGTITVNMTKAGSSPIGYLNALVIATVFDDGSAPVAPKALAATNVSGQGVNLTWQDIPYNETGFEVYRSSTLAGTYTLLTTTDANTVSYLDNSVSGGSTY
jgi:predicted esterase